MDKLSKLLDEIKVIEKTSGDISRAVAAYLISTKEGDTPCLTMIKAVISGISIAIKDEKDDMKKKMMKDTQDELKGLIG